MAGPYWTDAVGKLPDDYDDRKPPVDTGKLKSTPAWVPGYKAVMDAAIKPEHVSLGTKVDYAGFHEDALTGMSPEAIKKMIADGELAKKQIDKLAQQIINSVAIPSAVLNPPGVGTVAHTTPVDNMPKKPSTIGELNVSISANATEMQMAFAAGAAEGIKSLKGFTAKAKQDSIPNTHTPSPEVAPLPPPEMNQAQAHRLIFGVDVTEDNRPKTADLPPPEPTRKRRIILDD